MHKRKTFIIIAVLAALILTSGTSYYLGAKSQQAQPETVTAQTADQLLSSAIDRQPIDANNIFELVNDERVKIGRKPLVRNAKLDASALAKCNDLVTRDYWAHADPDGNMAWHYFTENGYKYTIAGENLAKDYKTAHNTVSGWMNSQLHKENILDSRYSDTGVAACGSNDTIVQHFASR